MGRPKRYEIPDAFRSLVRCASFMDELEPGGDDIASLVDGLSARQRRVAKAFVDEVLADDPGEDALLEIWNRCSDTARLSRGARRLFIALREHL